VVASFRVAVKVSDWLTAGEVFDAERVRLVWGLVWALTLMVTALLVDAAYAAVAGKGGVVGACAG